MENNGFMGRMPYTSATWRKCRIWLRTTAAPRCVEADVIGAVGVHVAPYCVDGVQVYRVTHVPTGRYIGDWPKSRAFQAAEILAKVTGELNTASVSKAQRVMGGALAG